MERLMKNSAAPTHDLIRIREPIALTADGPVPAWVEPALSRAPWVVVRRGHIRDGMMPVGVRGTARHERFAGLLAFAEIAESLSPEDLDTIRRTRTIKSFAGSSDSSAGCGSNASLLLLKCRGASLGARR